ncbi:hypothetical protein [Halomonas sp. RA08-2]|uniref:hypothetical protein n=1 Tax=Halomonas sp. RA08-2 TaxID=3440842 RepID=UPI003EEBA228
MTALSTYLSTSLSPSLLTRVARTPRATALAAAIALLLAGVAHAHPGHDAPAVHAHTGSPLLLAVLAISVLGLAALVPLARRALHQRRLQRQR